MGLDTHCYGVLFVFMEHKTSMFCGHEDAPSLEIEEIIDLKYV